MRLVGYCTGPCHRITYVRVSASQLALGAAIGGVCEGICLDCETPQQTPRPGVSDTVSGQPKGRRQTGREGAT